ncbi:MAG: hypothetical protein HDS11_08120 [Bacteroides sp.]|nr:hypothetical protein [Bacteroides sp.]
MNRLSLLTIIASAIMLCSCHDATPPDYADGKLPTENGGGSGSNDGAPDMEAELADASVRYIGPDLTLRFDTGGVLVKHKPDGSAALISLDEGSSAELVSEKLLRVNGKAVVIAKQTILRQNGSSRWIACEDTEGRTHLFVF